MVSRVPAKYKLRQKLSRYGTEHETVAGVAAGEEETLDMSARKEPADGPGSCCIARPLRTTLTPLVLEGAARRSGHHLKESHEFQVRNPEEASGLHLRLSIVRSLLNVVVPRKAHEHGGQTPGSTGSVIRISCLSEKLGISTPAILDMNCE